MTNSSEKKNIDFTKGSLMRALFAFSMPIMLGELLQSLYNSIDSLIVGNLLGKASLAAVSVCSPLTWLFIGFSTGISVGTGVVISKAFGGGDKEVLARDASTAGTASLLIGLLLSIIGVITVPLLLSFVSVPEEIYAEAALYLRIYLAGLVFTIIYNIAAGILRSIGDSKTPLYILLATALLNLIADFVLVYLIPLGVVGVAAATVISQLVSVMLALRKIKKEISGFRFNFRELRVNRRTVYEMARIAMPSGIQNSITYLSNIFVWRYVSSFVTAVIAGVGVAQKINKLVDYPCKGFGMALTTLTSQNAGAGKVDRIKQGVRDSMLLCGGTILALSLLLFLLSRPASCLFSDQEDVIAVSTRMLRMISPFYFFMLVREILGGVLRGNGISRPVMLLCLAGMVAVRQLYLAVSLSLAANPIHIYLCYPVAWIATALFIFVYFKIKKKQLFTEPLQKV